MSIIIRQLLIYRKQPHISGHVILCPNLYFGVGHLGSLTRSRCVSGTLLQVSDPAGRAWHLIAVWILVHSKGVLHWAPAKEHQLPRGSPSYGDSRVAEDKQKYAMPLKQAWHTAIPVHIPLAKKNVHVYSWGQ